MKRLFLFLLSSVLIHAAHAHKASDAYLLVKQSATDSPIELHLSVALRDLDRAMDTLDADNDRQITLGEVKASTQLITALIQQSIAWRCDTQDSPLSFKIEGYESRSDGTFVALSAAAPACDAQKIALRYQLMQTVDADHRAILSAEFAQMQSSRVLTPSSTWQAVLPTSLSGLETLRHFILLGIEHIGSGADHIAFVVCLVLGIALAQNWKTLLITITAFTLGHSITLIAATLGWVGSPAWVEPAIAASIAITAALNLFKRQAVWMESIPLRVAIAVSFGLIHGLGFSGAMTEAHVAPAVLPWALAGFNIGVEIGQLLIISVWSLVYFLLRRWQGYERWIVQCGSILLMVLSSYWLTQRLT
ncbi:MAG: HupE/UreJ family protein [Brachymonas sp.]